jgi:hypothetical protein
MLLCALVMQISARKELTMPVFRLLGHVSEVVVRSAARGSLPTDVAGLLLKRVY